MRIDKQKGVSLIITFFVMIIIVSVVLSVSILLYSEVKVMKNVGGSMISIFAADSGIEKVLYYDRKVLATMADESVAARGLCSMYMYDPVYNPNACAGDPNPSDPSLEHGIYCSPDASFTPPVSGDSNPDHGCDYNVCDDCTIKFSTIFDERTYIATAKIYPNGGLSTFEIESKGIFGSTERKIRIEITR